MKTGAKDVCVIGGAGYIGSRLVPALIARGHAVEVIDPCWFGNHLDPSVRVITSDVLTLGESSFNGYDTVIFLAGLSSDPMAEYASSFNFVSNLAAPLYSAFAARKAGTKRFIFADSCSVYGNAAGQTCDEAMPLTTAYPYGASKSETNYALQHLHSDSFSVIALRKGTVSGWSPRMRFDLLVNAMYKNAWLNKKIIVDNPSISRPLLSIEDAVAAYVLAVEAPEHLSGTYNISSLNVTVGGVAEAVQKHFKRVHSVDIPIELQNKKDLRDYSATIDKARKELGFEPEENVESILTSLDKHFGPSFDYNNDNHYNIRVFQKIFSDVTRTTLMPHV